jgi:integrase
MGIIKDRHGTYYVQRRVPERLQEAVARVLNTGERRVFLKKSLGTKSLKEAKVAAPHVLADFNRIVGEAEALLKGQPVITVLTDGQIKRMADHVYATALREDEELRFSGRLEIIGPHGENVNADALGDLGQDFRQQFAAGDVSFAEQHAQNALASFGITLNQSSTAYHNLCIESAKAFLKALDDIGLRYAGAVIETPRLPHPKALNGHGEGESLRDALDGWKKERERPENVIHEYARAVEMFIQLHGNLAAVEIKRSHALAFREALRLVPKIRKGTLLKAGLPELSQWGREHPHAPRVSVATVNKQLGAVQAIANWAYDKGLVPDDVPWSDPFRNMRLEEEQSDRGSFAASELQAVFNAPIFSGGEMPVGAQGAAGFWLPVVALFTGARQAEIAGLQVSNVQELEGVPLLFIAANRRAGKRLKTKASERVVPIHPELVKLGLLNHVAERARDGADAWLFPSVAPDQRRALSAWSKWFGYYLRKQIGVANPDRVFHSFRHSFQDALRRATPDAELRDTLPGRSSRTKSVSRDYGAKYMIDRWGARRLHETICNIGFPGLDLSRVRPLGAPASTRNAKAT